MSKKNYELYSSDQRVIDNLKRKIRGYEKMKKDITSQNRKVNNQNRKLQQENKKYKEVIDNLKDKLMEYFEVGRDSYFYVLTRDKSAFDYGTMSFDDFIEFSEEQVDDIVDFLKEVEHE